MIIKDVAEGVILSNLDSFNLHQIITCGQCFRWDETNPGLWRGVAFDTQLEIQQLDAETYLFKCSREAFDSLWFSYFDLARDYSEIKRSVTGDSFLEDAIQAGEGIRILQQEPFEILITFIISQCNNIPKIKTTITRLCEQLGVSVKDKTGHYYLFPTPQALADNPDVVKLCGVGYRDKYIVSASRKIVNGELDLTGLRFVSREDAYRELITLFGVGSKVANCILLFGLRHLDGFPEDLWIKKVLEKHYQGKFDSNRYNGFKGIIQQYMFYYGRILGANYFK